MMQLCTCCVCGCTVHTHTASAGWRFFSRQPKPGQESAENSTLTTTKMFAGLPATVCRTSNLFSGQWRSRILRCLQIVALLAVLFVTARNFSVFLLGSCQVLVMRFCREFFSPKERCLVVGLVFVGSTSCLLEAPCLVPRLLFFLIRVQD